MKAMHQGDALRRTYRAMSDEQLAALTLDANELSEAAIAFLHDEVRTRGTTTINELADTIDRRRFRNQCLSFSDQELELAARSATQLEEWQRDLLNQQLTARQLDVVPAAEEPVNEPPPVDHRPLVNVGKYRDLPEAQIAQSVLNSAGIPSFLADENTIRMDWLWSNLLGGIKLQVRASDAEAAEAMLQETMLELQYDGEDVEPIEEADEMEAHNEGSDGL
jgi:hypothetical protein